MATNPRPALEPRPAEPGVAEANEAVLGTYPFDDTQDMDDVRHGFLGTTSDSTILDADGRVVWDLEAYHFLERDCPGTANPSLWRQSRLTADHGLFHHRTSEAICVF